MKDIPFKTHLEYIKYEDIPSYFTSGLPKNEAVKLFTETKILEWVNVNKTNSRLMLEYQAYLIKKFLDKSERNFFNDPKNTNKFFTIENFEDSIFFKFLKGNFFSDEFKSTIIKNAITEANFNPVEAVHSLFKVKSNEWMTQIVSKKIENGKFNELKHTINDLIFCFYYFGISNPLHPDKKIQTSFCNSLIIELEEIKKEAQKNPERKMVKHNQTQLKKQEIEKSREDTYFLSNMYMSHFNYGLENEITSNEEKMVKRTQAFKEISSEHKTSNAKFIKTMNLTGTQHNNSAEVVHEKDNYWTAWHKRAKKIQENNIKEPLAHTDSFIRKIKEELQKAIETSISPSMVDIGQVVVKHNDYQPNFFSHDYKTQSIEAAFDKIIEETPGNPFSKEYQNLNPDYRSHPSYQSFHSFFSTLQVNINNVEDVRKLLNKTFNHIINDSVFILKNNIEIKENNDYYPTLNFKINHNLNILKGVFLALHDVYSSQYEEQYTTHPDNKQTDETLITEAAKTQELLFYTSEAILKMYQSQEIQRNLTEEPNSQENSISHLLLSTSAISHLKETYLNNFDLLSTYLQFNPNIEKNMLKHADLSKIYVPEFSHVLQKQTSDIYVASIHNYLLDNIDNYDSQHKKTDSSTFFFNHTKKTKRI